MSWLELTLKALAWIAVVIVIVVIVGNRLGDGE